MNLCSWHIMNNLNIKYKATQNCYCNYEKVGVSSNVINEIFTFLLASSSNYESHTDKVNRQQSS